MLYCGAMKQSLSKDIARVVRGILAERKITVQEFAAMMGEPNSSVARWINSGGSFKTDKLDEMADALGMDVAELVMLALAKRTSAAERDDLGRAMRRRTPRNPRATPEANDHRSGTDG